MFENREKKDIYSDKFNYSFEIQEWESNNIIMEIFPVWNHRFRS